MSKDNAYKQSHFAVEDGASHSVSLDQEYTVFMDKKAVIILGDDSDVQVLVRVGTAMVDWSALTDFTSTAGSGATKVTYVNIPFPCNMVQIVVKNDSGSTIQVSYYGGAA